ncbi:MAG: hypothetical protein KIT16_08655 [Rhodospirillaceae bacterium]|nr:hypothetical protein [Rhodospirillaceae bacterium]
MSHASFIESPLSAARMRLALRTQSANDNVAAAFADAPKAIMPARPVWHGNSEDSAPADSADAPCTALAALRKLAPAVNPLPYL